MLGLLPATLTGKALAPASELRMPWLFAIALFTSAFLLFVVQPLIANLLLPLLGGAPAVWTTCMVFYQVLLLLGYGYAHLLSRLRSRWFQIATQLSLLVAALFTLPFARTVEMEQSAVAGGAPVLWLLGQLLILVGLPFFIASTTGPLLQRWFSKLQHADAGDPYFLYSASNLGSLLALIGYPFLVEPMFGLNEQSAHWLTGFIVLIVLVGLCAAAFVRRRESSGEVLTNEENKEHEPLSWRRRGTWVLLAFVPSSLLLGVTTHLTTDIASAPLLWIIPLSIYLLSFVLVFARREWISLRLCNRALPVTGILLVFAMLCRATEPVVAVILIHLGFFANALMVAHGRLAADRPKPENLTEFYLWMSVGGALGGFFNALLAPVVFNEVWEYPIAVLLACLLYRPPAQKSHSKNGLRKWLYPAFVLLLATVLVGIAGQMDVSGLVVQFVVFGVPVVLCFPLATRPRLFAATLAGIFVLGQIQSRNDRELLFNDRSFFGVSRVIVSENGQFVQLDHGTTSHGRQSTDAQRKCEPLSYYNQNGPLGGIMRVFNERHPNGRVGLIGLGAGATLNYALPDQKWDVYEIDPLVIQIAKDERFFTYLSDCSAVAPNVFEGDARLRLQDVEAGRYDLLILDAFSSDAVPRHLLTLEAMKIYFDRIADDGWLALHISNRYLNLEQIIAGAANELDLQGFIWFDLEVNEEVGEEESHWVVLSRDASHLHQLNGDPSRIPLESRPSLPPWTDDRSSILPLFKW